MVSRARKPFTERLWDKVDMRGPDDCWPWTGHLVNGLYGMIRRGKADEGQVGAHVAIWEAMNGPSPSGFLICHSCDNPPCCNPAHLFPGTYQVNSADMVSKGRQARGSKNARAALSEDDVDAIRTAAEDGISRKSLAARYGVTKKSIGNILLRRTWAHLP